MRHNDPLFKNLGKRESCSDGGRSAMASMMDPLERLLSAMPSFKVQIQVENILSIPKESNRKSLLGTTETNLWRSDTYISYYSTISPFVASFYVYTRSPSEQRLSSCPSLSLNAPIAAMKMLTR